MTRCFFSFGIGFNFWNPVRVGDPGSIFGSSENSRSTSLSIRATEADTSIGIHGLLGLDVGPVGCKPVSCVYHWSSRMSLSANGDILRRDAVDIGTDQQSSDMGNPTVTKRFNTGHDNKVGRQAVMEQQDEPVHMDGRISRAGYRGFVWQKQKTETGRVGGTGERIAGGWAAGPVVELTRCWQRVHHLGNLVRAPWGNQQSSLTHRTTMSATIPGTVANQRNHWNQRNHSRRCLRDRRCCMVTEVEMAVAVAQGPRSWSIGK
jgi:hypothetical protein